MPSPPPRKIKPTVWLREVHTKQLSSLQTREQQLLDIIEDIRSYAKQRADIERNYGQALLKLSSQLLAKKELFVIEEQNPSEENRTIQATWKSCLEETDKIGNIRVKAADVYSQNVSERCKALRTHKAAAIKRALDQLTALQTDLSQSVKEFGATHQQYTDDEVKAFEYRSKAESAGQKLNNKETGLFSSVGTLKKTQAKTFAKMQQANAASGSSRNGYLLELAAVNAHTNKLHTKHIPTLFKALDDGVYDQLASCISVLAQTEIDSCNETLSTHNQVVSNADKVSPKYNLECFLQANTVFSEQLTFHFEPVQDDPIQNLSCDYNEDKRLEIETRNWSRKVAKETRSLAELHDRINQVTNTQGGEAQMELELNKLESLVRRSEIAKLKAEARLELLRTANMPVDAMLAQATAEHDSSQHADTHSLTSRGSSHHSDTTFDSSGDNLDSPNRQGHFSPNRTSQYSTNSYQSANQASTFKSSTNQNQSDNASTSQDSALATMIAIYDYPATQPDELTLREGELLTILDHGTGDGWFRACNSEGQTGMVPENYIEPYEDTASLSAEPSDNVNEAMTQHNSQQYDPSPAQQQYNTNQPPPASHGMGYVRAVYDYSADGPDEISFAAGSLIALLSRDENGIDDGYWKGEVDGRQGMFPSMLVEEIDDNQDLPPPTDTQEDNQQQPNNFETAWEKPANSRYTQDTHTPKINTLSFTGSYNNQPIAPTEPSASASSAISRSHDQNIESHDQETVSHDLHTASDWSQNQPYLSYDQQVKAEQPLPAEPEEIETRTEPELREEANLEVDMQPRVELYGSHPSPRVRQRREIAADNDNSQPPAINRHSKPNAYNSPSKTDKAPQHSSIINNIEVQPAIPQSSPKSVHSAKPVIEDSPPHPAAPTPNPKKVGQPVMFPSDKPQPPSGHRRPPPPPPKPQLSPKQSEEPQAVERSPKKPEQPAAKPNVAARPNALKVDYAHSSGFDHEHGFQHNERPEERQNQHPQHPQDRYAEHQQYPQPDERQQYPHHQQYEERQQYPQHQQYDERQQYPQHQQYDEDQSHPEHPQFPEQQRHHEQPHHPDHQQYAEDQRYPPQQNIRGRYEEIRSNRQLFTEQQHEHGMYDIDEDKVEGRRFRQMQPMPHQYYMEHAGGRPGGYRPDLKDIRERSSSGRSFGSISSSESQDDKQTPIRIPGRQHLSSDSPSEPTTPVTPMSLKEASRMMPKTRISNASYRVATMSDMNPVDMEPTSRDRAPAPHSRHHRPTPSRRQGGLPGHVRKGINQDELQACLKGRKTLHEAATDSPPAAVQPQPMRKTPSKSETAV